MQEHDLIDYLKNDLSFEGELTPQTELFSSGELDSASMVQVILFLEEKAGIQINAEDVNLENFDSVSRIVSYVSQQS